jgi:hypothetical protein
MRTRQLTIKRGECSGIPACCVLWFTYVWLPIYEGKREYIDIDTFRDTWFKREREAFGFYIGYIPCDDCIRNRRRVDIKRCAKIDKNGIYECDCNGELNE